MWRTGEWPALPESQGRSASPEWHPEAAVLGVMSGQDTLVALPVRTVVAIPVHNEGERLPRCLRALSTQRDQNGRLLGRGDVGIVLLLNNCTDRSALIAATWRRMTAHPLLVGEVTLAPHRSNAGYARRLAMDAGATWLARRPHHDGLLLTTDADSVVAPDWVARHLQHCRNGIDAVAGRVHPDPGELKGLPLQLRRRVELEHRYAALLSEIESVLDPVCWDPWPRHAMASGASLGVSVSWYRRIGGLPLLSLGEDRALIERLRAAGARLRHCPRTTVMTSSRLIGRAKGGMADTLRGRVDDPDTLCDPALPPLGLAMRRYKARAAGLTLSYPAARPASQRDGIHPARLPDEIRRAEQVLLALRLGRLSSGLRATARERPADTLAFAVSPTPTETVALTS
jgi:GT2 family glycosyltransferase